MTDMKDFPPELHEIVGAIVRDYKPVRIVLFGSYARGEATPPHSDLDLLIVKEGARSDRRESAKIRSCIRPWIGPHSFTILPISPERLNQRLAMQEAFIGAVLQEGIELYAAN